MKIFKTFLGLFVVLLLILPNNAYAQEQRISIDEYHSELEKYDLSFFDDKLDSQTKEILSELGIDEFDIYNIASLSFNDIAKALFSIAVGKMKTPIMSALEILVFVLLSAFLLNFKDSIDNSMEIFYSTASAVVIVLILSTKISMCIAICCSTIGIASDFIYAFLPVFFIIVSSSGGLTTSVSTNTLLLMLSQGLSFISSSLFIPLINSFLAVGICSSLNHEIKLNGVIVTLKKGITKSISILSATFVSILTIKTAVAAKADALGLRSMRFAINTVVPVIGPAISEGLLSIQSYSSLIKTSVGIVGVIAIILVFIPSIIEVTIWRIVLSFCSMISVVFDDTNVSGILNIFKDGLLLINVVLILSMLTTVVSFGILIVAKTG